jgi:N-terminal domain of anti-restriction factor ArdC
MRNLRSHPTQRRDHYQELTDKIIAALEAGVAPWRRPWEIVCVKFSKWRSFGLGLGGLAELGFLVLFEIVHVEVSVGFEPVLMSFDGQRSDKTAAGA